VTPRARLIVLWAVGVVALTFIEAIARLGSRAWLTIAAGLSAPQWIGLIVATATLLYFEGYRALQLRFAPEVVQRAIACAHGSTSTSILAPLYALALCGPDRSAVIRGRLVGAGIVAAIVIVRQVPHPWRGVIDGGVAVALLWGLGALLIELRLALRTNRVAGV